MLRFSFSLNELPAKLVDSEICAYYRLDGTLRLHQGPEVVFEEGGVPLVEFAVWLSSWWKSNQPAQSYMPDGSDPDYGPMLLLAPTGGTHYRLTYTWGDTQANRTAEQAEWGNAVTQFCEDLRQIVLKRYHLCLDNLLPSS
ncbi:hypothetical protein PK28_08735 [Hymenobacter sp. DG25B]|nr:hypothetical protein PK28_08735 [Hymenobacter sp. DG25B]